MSRHTRSKRNRQSRGAQGHRRRRVLGLGTGAGAVLAFGLGPWGVAPVAHADEFDLILEPIINSLSSIDPTLGADSWSTLAQGLEQDWITSPFGTQVDSMLNTWAEKVDPSYVGDSCGLICNGADGTSGGTLAQADGQDGGVWFGDGGTAATAGSGGAGGELGGTGGDGGNGGHGDSTGQLAKLAGKAGQLAGKAGQLGRRQLAKLAKPAGKASQLGRRQLAKPAGKAGQLGLGQLAKLAKPAAR